MAARLPDGSIQMSDGRVLYANSVILAADLLELMPLFTPPPAWPFVSGGGGGGGTGRDGAAGPAGADGADGSQGFQGIQGLQGTNPGVQGPQGNQGVLGLQGLQGLLGPQGLQGLQGVQGPQGVQGVQGLEGPQGNQGIQGLQGTNPGVQGPQGFQGVQGSGVEGTQGFQGNQGLQGTNPGVQGPQGFQGFQGAVGAGVQGAQGPQGNQGNQGLAGFTNSARFAGSLSCAGFPCTATFSTGALGFTPLYARLSTFAFVSATKDVTTDGAFVGTLVAQQTFSRMEMVSAGPARTGASGTGAIGQLYTGNFGSPMLAITCTAFGAGGITISAGNGVLGGIPAAGNNWLLEVFG